MEIFVTYIVLPDFSRYSESTKNTYHKCLAKTSALKAKAKKNMSLLSHAEKNYKKGQSVSIFIIFILKVQ